MDQLLALGSVVKAWISEEATGRFVIAGYFPKDNKTGKIYDYVTVSYPWGMNLGSAVQLINEAQIVEVEWEGYLDENAEVFTKTLPEMLKEYSEQLDKLIQGNADKTESQDVEMPGEKSAEEKVSIVDPFEEFG